jgi:hypothetical protein
MKRVLLMFAVTVLAACHSEGSSPGVDATPQADAAADAAPPEPKPAFQASASVGGKLAIDDAGIRATYGSGMSSIVTLSLTEQGKTTSCGFTVEPRFLQFGTASTSTRQFKTVMIDFAQSTVHRDDCKWDDAHVLQALGAQFGAYTIGFAQARFPEDRPYVDVFLDAVQPFPNQTANIVYAGGGLATAMAADGTITGPTVEPAPGTLVRALYDF